MSILIKGMEMPESCAKCPICAAMPLGDYAVYHKCVLLNRLASKRNRRYDCPLVEVPTPHGRLIDADEFFDKIPPGDIEHDEKISRTGAIADVCTWVLSAPTVIEAEE